MYTYELLLTQEHTSAEDWQRFFNVISTRVKGFHPVTLDIVFEGSIVRYFTHSKKDLSHISNGLDGFLLITLPVHDEGKIEPPHPASRKYFLYFSKLATVLDIKEKYVVKKGLDLKFARFRIQRIFGKLFWKRIFYFDFHGITKRNKNQSLRIETHMLDIDFLANSSYIKKRIDNYLDIEKTAPFFNTRKENALVKIDTFPYTVRDHYIHLSDFEFDKHSFIVGSSGSGKSRFIELFINRLYETNMNLNYRVIVIDPHDSLREDLVRLPDSRIINFSHEGASLFPEAEADITASTELTSTLLLSMMGHTNARLERVLRFSTFVLFVAQAMSLSMLKKFATDLDTRTQVLAHVKGYIPENIEHFFGSEFNEIRTQYYTEAIQPIVALVDEMELQPTLSAGNDMSIAHMVRDNFLTVFSLNKVRMGEKVVKTVAGLLIQQIFLLAQARAFGSKVLLFVDEVSVVQNPTLAAILAEARKFGMSVILTQQYFGQVETGLQQAILSNAINYYVFKVSEEDARVLEGNLSMEIPKEIVEREMRNGLTETDIRVKMMTELHPRECIVRVAASGRLLPAMKARTMDVGIVEGTSSESGGEDLSPFARQDLPEKFAFHSAPADLPTLESEKILDSVQNDSEVATPLPTESSPPDLPTESEEKRSIRSVGNAPRGKVSTNAHGAREPAHVNRMSMAEVLSTQSSSRIPITEKTKSDSDSESETKPPLAPYVPQDS